MKTIEDIKKEYDEFECRITSITSLEELEAWIEVAFDDIDENMRLLKVDYNYNRNYRTLAYITNLLPFLFEHEDLSFYDKDDKIIEESTVINKIYKNYFKQIAYYSNDDNYLELAKFADFVMFYYDKDVTYLYEERVGLEYQKKGYGYISNSEEDNSEVVHEFLSLKINELSSAKGIEKVKKM